MARRAALLVVLVGCRGKDTGDAPTFGSDFLWGSATAGFQVEMGCPTLPEADCTDAGSDWYAWVTDPSIVGDAGLYVTGEPVTAGPGMWETYDDDFAAMSAAGLRAFRFSFEWSRLFPDGAAEAATTPEELAAYADPEAVAGYHAWLDAMRARGLTPLATANHYTLPLWVHEPVACHADIAACPKRGWVDGERIVPLISTYAGFLGAEFGADVDWWGTLNEPSATALSGYVLPGEDRSAPPGLTLAPEAVAVLLNQIDGSARMYDAIKAADAVDADGDGDAARVGVVLNFVAIDAKEPGTADDVAVEQLDHLYHAIWLEGLTSGAWDGDLDGVFEATRPELAARLDWIGVNYYNRVEVSDLPIPLMESVPVSTFFPTFSWDPYPEGMGRVVDRASGYGLPIVITENGTPDVDGASAILDGHLASLADAMARGADVRGYFYWSWVDNYEWNHGMAMQFGLNALDPATKAREPRDVFVRYQEIVAAGRVDAP
jgi:beta-glucosidase/6-phospho-beta-glucosidase/beta-galactosidase